MSFVQIEREPGEAPAVCAQATLAQPKHPATPARSRPNIPRRLMAAAGLLNSLAEQVGRETFIGMVREAVDSVVRRKTAGRASAMRNLSAFSATLKSPPPIVEDTPQVFEYRVSKCLWAKTFRDENAGDVGYAMICYPDYPVARGLNPKLKLIRDKTLMQGNDCCVLRYVMET
jgi:hypothetical protein